MTQPQQQASEQSYLKLLQNIDLEVLGKRVRHARMEKKWSQRELSSGLFTSAYLSTLELGKTRPTYKSLTGLAERLDKPLDYFLRPSSGGVGGELDEEQTRLMTLRLNLLMAQTRLEHFADEAGEEALEAVKSFLPSLGGAACARYYYLRGRYFNLKELPDDALAELEEATKCLAAHPDSDAELRVGIECEQGLALLKQRRLMVALTHFQTALALLDSQPSQPALQLIGWKVEIHTAQCLLLLDQTEGAINHYEEALAQASALIVNPAEQARLYEELAALYQKQGDFERASFYLGRSLEVYTQEENERLLLTTFNALAQLYAESGQYDQAEKLLDQALGLARRLEVGGEQCEELNALVTRAATSQKQGNLPQAQALLQRALDLEGQCSDPAQLGRMYRLAGEIWAEAGDRVRAEGYFKQALVKLEGTSGLATHLSEVYHSYGQRLREWGEFDEAFKLMEQAFRLREQGRTTSVQSI